MDKGVLVNFEKISLLNKLNKLQKTKEGKQLIKDAGFKKGQIKEVQKIFLRSTKVLRKESSRV